MIDLNGPDIETVDEVTLEGGNSGICQFVEELQDEDTVKE
jgi:hypothetical protein